MGVEDGQMDRSLIFWIMPPVTMLSGLAITVFGGRRWLQLDVGQVVIRRSTAALNYTVLARNGFTENGKAGVGCIWIRKSSIHYNRKLVLH